MYKKKKKIAGTHGVLLYKKALMSEHRKNYILRDINNFVKMSVSTLVSWYVTTFCVRSSSKSSGNIKTKYPM